MIEDPTACIRLFVQRLRRERGQIFALTAVLMVALLALGAFVLDVGAWFREQRHTQQVADASALAGASALPRSTSQAQSLALTYANTKNTGTVNAADVQFSSYAMTNDTITVTARNTSPSFFAKVLGFGNVNLTATAAARASVMSQAKYAAPFAIEKDQPYLVCGLSCYGPGWDTTLDLNKTGPGNFKIVNVDGSHGGTGPGTLGDWVTSGYNGYMGVGWFFGDTGTKFNSTQVKQAMDGRLNSDLLFPVYDAVQAQGSGFQYEVVGWATFHVTSFTAKGSCNKDGECTITGYFVSVDWEGIPGGDPGNNFGTLTVKLVS